MPINNLTVRLPDTPSLVRFGKIRKGAPKPEEGNRPGKDLDHFRITLEPDYVHLAEDIEREFGPEPTSIPVVFVGETVEEVFPSWFEAWVASGLMHRCDGETQEHGVAESGEYEAGLPCERGEKSNIDDPKTFKCGCVRGGKLHVAIPSLWGIQGEYGKFILETHSIHDIIELHGRLSTMYKLFGSLMMVPATLGRAERQISFASPKAKSGRQNRTASLLTIRENVKAMRRTHPEIANKIQGIIDASAGGDQVEAPALPAGDDDKHGKMAEWFGQELQGITPATIRAALANIADDAARPVMIAAVL